MSENAPTSPRPARLDVWIELALAALSVVVLVAVTLGTPTFPQLGLALAAVLLAVRAVRGRAAWERLRPRWRPGTWLCRLRVADLAPIAVFLALVAVLHVEGGRLEVDGPLLYIQVRSLVIDHDLDYTNEFAAIVPPQYQFIAEEARRLGRSPDPMVEPGPALLWLPFFVVGHGLTLASRAVGVQVAPDGYGPIYQNAVCLGNLVWVLVGVLLTVRFCARFFPRRIAAGCAAGAWLGTPLLWYSVYEPLMPHATATFSAAHLMWQWARVMDRPEPRGRWLALVFAGGLLVSMERYDAYLLVAPALTLPILLRERARVADRSALKRFAVSLGAASLVLAATTLPLMLVAVWSRHRSITGVTNLLGFALKNWAHPYFQELLFSSRGGFFAWSPIAYLGVLGLVLLAARQRRVPLALLLTLGAGIYLLAASYGWHGAWSYGSRRLTEAFPIIVLGLCAAAAFVLARPAVLGSLALGGLVTGNLLLAGQIRRGEVPLDGTFSFSDVAARAARRLYGTVGHPPSFPATWVFALRYGVPPDRFDALVGREPIEEPVIRMGAEADAPFVGRGWSIAESPPEVAPFRWSMGNESTVLVVLGPPRDYVVTARCAAAPHPRNSPQRVVVQINGRPAGLWAFTPQVAERPLLAPARLWSTGINEVRLVYAWTVRAGEAAGSPDARQIAVRAEEFRLTPTAVTGEGR